MNPRTLAAAATLAILATSAHAGDAARGKIVFKRCQSCHTATEPNNRVGPSLMNLIGRPVAAVETFRYSEAMKTFGAGKVWNEELLTEYLPAPRALVPGTSMAFAGVKKPEDIENLIAYLKDPASAE
jgi:cytochrome c